MGLGDWLLNLPYERGPLSPFASQANPFMRMMGPQMMPRLQAQESALMEDAPWMVGYEGLPAPLPAPEAPVASPIPIPPDLIDQGSFYATSPGARFREGFPYEESKRKKKKKREEE